MRYMLRSLCVPGKGPTGICRDNLGMIISCTNPDLELNKKRVTILYQKLRESAAARAVNPDKLCTLANQSNILNKSTPVRTLISSYDTSYGFDWGEA